MFRFLVIQTAFTGDVVLATALVEKLHASYPDARIDFLLRKGNEGLLDGHPFIGKVLVWNKKKDKIKNLWSIIRAVRRTHYTHIINAHRFASSGFITMLSGAPNTSGFNKNPLAFAFSRQVPHTINTGLPAGERPVHEVERNQQLIAHLTDKVAAMPALYPSAADEETIKAYTAAPFICIAPASVWFTKQFPAQQWAELIKALPLTYTIYLIGAPSDDKLAENIIALAGQKHNVVSLCGKLSFLQSAALMKQAVMNYTNDSAPLHFASAVNAPATAVFCSTVPSFGFGPLRDNARIVETAQPLSCRPCGLHGHRTCPEGHFKCAQSITNDQLLWWISKTT